MKREKIDLVQAQLRKAVEQFNLDELGLQKKAAEYATVESLILFRDWFLEEMDEWFRELPERAAAQVSKRDREAVRTVLEAEIRILREDFRERLDNFIQAKMAKVRSR